MSETNILTNTGYISSDKLQAILLPTINSKSQTFSSNIIHSLTDANTGKIFQISNFPINNCIIKEIRVRSNFISNQQNWRVAFINNLTGITPTDISIICNTAQIFDVGDYINIEDEIALVLTVDIPTSTITVTRGVKGTTASYHNYNARIETANDGLRLILFKSSIRILSNKLKLIKYLMSWKGNTNAPIIANDKVIKFSSSPNNNNNNLNKYDYLYLIDGNNSERISIENVNGIVANTTYNNSVYTSDQLLAHPTNIEVQKQMIYDIPIIFSGGDGNLYGTLFVDEKIDSVLYPSGITATIEIVTETFYNK